MKRSYVIAIALVCFALGGIVSHFAIRRADAQTAPVQIGRYQLFQGRFWTNTASTATEVTGVFRLDTATGKTDGYFDGTNKAGKLSQAWIPIGE